MSTTRSSRRGYHRLPVDDRWERLGELAVTGANVQRGQVLLVTAEHGQAEAVRAVATAAYKRGASYVDVSYFDPYLKQARIEHADQDTLAFVPEWLGASRVAHAASRGARISFGGVTVPNLLAGLDPDRLGKDQLPRLKESGQIVSDRTTNWCIVPAPHPEWAKLVYPDLAPEDAYERLWADVEHITRLDQPDVYAAWAERMTVLNDSARRLTERRFDAIHLEGPGTDLTVGLFRSGTWWAADFSTVDGLSHYPNLPTEEVFTTPDPVRTEGHVTSTKPLVLNDGTIIRGLRVRFEGGRAVEIDADENGPALKAHLRIDESATRLGELALVDRQGLIGPLGTVFYDTLLDENAASHIALGHGFPFAVDEEDLDQVNDSRIHIDFMIGSPELEVTGITKDGDRVPVLHDGNWQI
jgi:aminopeptidase